MVPINSYKLNEQSSVIVSSDSKEKIRTLGGLHQGFPYSKVVDDST
jgi:hypothetical protein